MSSPLLRTFAATVVDRLVARDLLVLVDGRRDDVVGHVADHLAGARHASLVSSVTRALLTCDGVDELFADDDDVKALIDDLDRREAGLARG